MQKTIRIDASKCNGCGACAAACHEGAIKMIDGKAKVVRQDVCDGLGACLPHCPTGALELVEETPPRAIQTPAAAPERPAFGSSAGCPGMRAKSMDRPGATAGNSALRQWPCQIKLVPERAPYLAGADLLIAADCTAYAYGDFHNAFMAGRITLIGCPKLDDTDYAVKLARIFTENRIASVRITRMEVPCCGGLVAAVRRAIEASGKTIPLEIVTISTDGNVLHTEQV